MCPGHKGVGGNGLRGLNLKCGLKASQARQSDATYGVIVINVGVPPAGMVSGIVPPLVVFTVVSLEVWISET